MDDPLLTWSPTRTIRGEEATETESSTARSVALSPELAGEVDEVALTLGERIGVGGMGVVDAATQHSLGREVAVKRVTSGRTGAIAGLLREARVAGRIEHPAIVPVHALGWHGDTPAMVMKRVEGAPWSELLADPHRGPWHGREGDPFEWHLDVLLEVCHALELAHSRGVLHRDVKPENVMVGAFGEVYLLDWGIAWLLDEDPGGDGRIVGTPAYMAPEMTWAGGAGLGVRTDVYLLGATLHELLTGQLRHPADDTPGAIALARASDPFLYGPDVPPDLADVCNRACACDPGDRFPDVAAFRRALEQHRAHRGSLAATRTADREFARLCTLVEGAPDPLEVHRRYAACRFGYAQALLAWPDNPRAREGLAEAAARMVAFELARGDAGAAAAVVAELEDPDPAVVAQVEAAAARRDALLAEGARMLALQDELRVAGRDWGRSAVTLFNGFLGLGMFAVFGWYLRGNGQHIDGQDFLLACAVGLGVNLLGLFAFRRALLDNRAYLRLMQVLILIWVLGIGLGGGGLLLGIGWHALLLGACAVITTVCAVLAVTFDGLFWSSTAIALLFSALAVSTPAYAPEIIGFGYLLHSTWFAWALRPGAESRPAGSGPAMWREDEGA